MVGFQAADLRPGGLVPEVYALARRNYFWVDTLVGEVWSVRIVSPGSAEIANPRC